MKLHYAFDKHKVNRPTDYCLETDKQRIYDYLTLSIDKNSLAIVCRTARDDGVLALEHLRKHYVRETEQRTHLHLKTLFNMKMENILSGLIEEYNELQCQAPTMGEGLFLPAQFEVS